MPPKVIPGNCSKFSDMVRAMKFPVPCWNRAKGCTEQHNMEKIEEHESECEYTEPAAARQVIQVDPDKQHVMYSVTGEDGQTQQYTMVCPKDMDQNTLIETIVKQISSDPATKGKKKTIRITQQKGANKKAAASAAAAATPAAGISPTVVPSPERVTPVSSRNRNMM